VESFNWIVAVRRLSTGNLVIANFDPISIRVFDRAGHLASTFGRKGEGPGEYIDLSDLIVLPGDSLLLLDRMLRRFTLLDQSGKYIRSFSFAPPFATPPFDVSVQPLGDGTVLIGYAEATATRPSPAPVLISQAVGRYATTGARLNSLGRFFYGDYFLQATPSPHVGGGSALWERAFARKGILVADVTSIWIGDASAFEATRYSLDGRPLETHRLDQGPHTVDPSDIAAYQQRELAAAKPADLEVERRRVAEMPYPKAFPAYRRVLLDAKGRIWMQRYAPTTTGPTTWWVLDPVTRSARAVLLPERFYAFFIGGDDVVGVWRDADDVEHVPAYRLRLFDLIWAMSSRGHR
jgi:hypothetical protein